MDGFWSVPSFVAVTDVSLIVVDAATIFVVDVAAIVVATGNC